MKHKTIILGRHPKPKKKVAKPVKKKKAKHSPEGKTNDSK